MKCDVSREAYDRLRAYWQQLLHWNRRINLVADGESEHAWLRHIEDALQLEEHMPPHSVLHVDLGSGGGLPAIPLAILRADRGHDDDIVMIEADRRKAAFLGRAIAKLGMVASVIADRAETCEPQSANIVTARAMAPLRVLLHHVWRHGQPSALAILPKGRRLRDEMEEVMDDWQFDYEVRPSRTSEDGRILILRELRPRR